MNGVLELGEFSSYLTIRQMSEYQLSIDESLFRVNFETDTLSGAKAGLLELKRRKKLYLIRKREAYASVRERRVIYRGHQGIRKFRSSNKGALSGIVAAIANFVTSMKRTKAYEHMAGCELEVSKIDRVIAAIDKAIIELESEIVRAKNT